MRPARDDDSEHRRRWLTLALKAVRRRRNKTAAEVAAAMNMKFRTYERFETGRERLHMVDRVHAFAEALSADPYGILLGVDVGSPELAARTADNKLPMILLLWLQDLDADLGDDLVQLDSETITTALDETMRRLSEIARQRAAGPAHRRLDPSQDD